MKSVLTCLKLCLSLYYEGGLPVKGMPEKCFCGEQVDKSTPEPLEITIHLPKEKKQEPERYDDRPKVDYNDE